MRFASLFSGILIVAACLASGDDLLFTARQHLVAQRFAEALVAVEQYLGDNPRNVEALKLKGDVYYLLGKDGPAEQAFLAAVRIDPKFVEGQYSLGRVYYQQSRYDAAIEQFQKVLALQPDSYKAYDNLGLCYEHLNEVGPAVRYYLKSIELVHKDVPTYDWPYANLANLLIDQADYKKAFNLATEAAQRNPHSARNYYLVAKALTHLDQSEKSLRWLRRAIELDPEYPEPRYLLAQQLRKQGATKEAEE
ncbi:MAG TPA: tetratricopeptide repeat protein, partial [Bryobacteraceae bacterium]|nr:tetratricopeptide repeat protein [Bryobacteraceae bacterium]